MRTILILEDDTSVVRLIEVNLRGVGFHTVEARTVGEAWKLAQETHFDAAIVDIHLPGVYGWEFIERLRRDRVRERVPVLITSGNLRDEDLRKCTELRCEVLEKPFDPGSLIERIQALVGYDRKLQLRTRSARVILDGFVLEGNLHLPEETKRFSDGVEELMRDERSLIPMTAVRVLRLEGELLYEAAFIQISKAQIRAVTDLADG